MPLDALCLSGIVHELNTALAGSKIDKIYQPGRDEILLALRTQGGNAKLLLSANPSHPRPQLTQLPRENPDTPPMFCMLLRKLLTSGRTLEVTLPPLERVVVFRLEALDELGDRVERRLMLEVISHRANLVLLDGEGKLESILLDELEVSVSADSTGHVTLPTDWRTKRQKGVDYPLAEVSSLKKGWAEQADAFANYLIGMTPEQVSMLKVDKDGKATDADLLSGCTIAVDRYRDAVTRACANARVLGAAKGDRAALGIEAVNETSDITATDDSNFLSGKIRALVCSNITKEGHSRDDAFCMFAFDTKLLISACTDGNKNSIIFLAETLNCDILTNTFSKFYLNSCLKDCLNVFVKTIFRKSVVRDSIAEHSAKLWKHLEYGCLMSHQLQVVSSAESTRSTAYDSDTLSGGRCAFRWRNLACIISGHTFQSTDIDGIIYDISTAAGLTRMLADKTAGCREWVILSD